MYLKDASRSHKTKWDLEPESVFVFCGLFIFLLRWCPRARIRSGTTATCWRLPRRPFPWRWVIPRPRETHAQCGNRNVLDRPRGSGLIACCLPGTLLEPSFILRPLLCKESVRSCAAMQDARAAGAKVATMCACIHSSSITTRSACMLLGTLTRLGFSFVGFCVLVAKKGFLGVDGHRPI